MTAPARPWTTSAASPCRPKPSPAPSPMPSTSRPMSTSASWWCAPPPAPTEDAAMTLRTGNTLAAACLAVFGSLTFASLEAAGNERHERGVEVMDPLSGGAGQPVLEALREEYPFLAEGIRPEARRVGTEGGGTSR